MFCEEKYRQTGRTEVYPETTHYRTTRHTGMYMWSIWTDKDQPAYIGPHPRSIDASGSLTRRNTGLTAGSTPLTIIDGRLEMYVRKPCLHICKDRRYRTAIFFFERANRDIFSLD